MKNLLLLLLAISTIVTFTNTALAQESKQFSIGINFSPDLIYQKSGIENTSISYGELRAASLTREHQSIKNTGYGYTAGLNIRYQLSQKIGIETGAHFSNRRYTATYLPKVTTGHNSSLSKLEYSTSLNYLQIPLRGILTLGENKIKFISSIGVAASLFMNSTNTLLFTYSDKPKEENPLSQKPEYDQFNISSTFSAGITYQINEKMSLNIEPTFSHRLLRINDTFYKEHIWNAGLNISCFYLL